MDGEVCQTCGGNCMICKVTGTVGPLLIIALAWVWDMFFPALYSKIAITVIALAIAATVLFCPCKKGGVNSISSGTTATAAPKATAKPAAKPMAAKAAAPAA